MPHALLLSPDDQAVNAITGVLEEMSVTCERPLDGVSAAHKLNSTNFDLVLVDCENLPAAKLIFDVCRRGNNGHNPVPIAIVDGRAGLPTAFRLGAELILTKPVAKDQARSTIRTAVSRIRKDVPANETSSAQAASAVGSDLRAQAAVAASSPLTSFSDPVPSYVSSSPAGAGTATAPNAAIATTLSATSVTADEARPASPKFEAPSAALATPSFSASSSTQIVTASSNIVRPSIPSDDPVLAELERTEQEEAERAKVRKQNPELDTTPRIAVSKKSDATSGIAAYSSRHRQKKTRGSVVALLVLMLVICGFYAAGMYQPGFQTVAKPKINHFLALAGAALPATQTQDPAKPLTRPESAAAAASAPALSATSMNASASTPDSTPGSPAASTIELATGPASITTGSTVAAASTPGPASHSAAATVAAGNTTAAGPSANQPASKSSDVKSDVKSEAKSGTKKDVPAAPSTAPLPGEDSATILSSKGAEKRLTYSVAPKYPVEALSAKTEGTVVLKAVVDDSGKIDGVRLVEGNATLATAAIQAVKQWRYRPYLRDGKAQSFQTVVIVDFQRP
jgi:TonB family protein